MSTNMKRIMFEPRVKIINPRNNDDKQFVDFTCYFKIGDIIDVVDTDIAGNTLSIIGENLSILEVNDELNFIKLSSGINISNVQGHLEIMTQEIDDGQKSMERLYRRKLIGRNIDPHSGYSYVIENSSIEIESNKQSTTYHFLKHGGFIKHSGFLRRE